ncbi:MAG TPA: EAL domain-containing protein [Sphingomonas sp.]|uniref:putative bifunctional diguanylate cyclase/phosphodiesterase n=1 Tax=Sphingomonas sp. TaxID=28214 RepID=UPI002CE76F7D|nr:EAL domain-containing protein [Sphingomonas sp.]HMI20110.1 EAL domain-containing protein [Sphingomonas sp.]
MLFRRPFGFRQLRTRLAVLYAGLFAVAMLCVAGLLYGVVAHNSKAQVRKELVVNGTVFDRLWDQQTSQLRGAAGLLARDFGFRAAVATHDRNTIESALVNLRERVGLSTAFIVDVNGNVTGLEDPREAKEASALSTRLDEGVTAGVAPLGGQAHKIVAAPIMAPALTGWVVFAAELDQHEMRSLERLSAIPLTAAVYQRNDDGSWHGADRSTRAPDPAVSRFIEANWRQAQPAEIDGPGGLSIALAKRLPTVPGAPPAVLLLQYPMRLALRPYRPLEIAIAVIGIFGLALVVMATWRMARSITLPISLLDAAAGKLADGQLVSVPIGGMDELGRLAATFNRMSSDIVEREKRITHLAFNDLLTSLPNRANFNQHLDHQLRLVERRGGQVALLCMDLDNFKAINDTLGHPTGDELLRRIAARLGEEVGDIFVARLGGDEFVMVKPFNGETGAIDELARRALAAVEAPIHVNEHVLENKASVGIAIAPADGTNNNTLLRSAELALYKAKEAGRGTYRFFEESMNALAQARRALEVDMRHALANGELELHYQPLFHLAADRVGGFEALLRWNHPTRGSIPPAEFIPIAEETGLIVQIGTWVIQEACRQATRWPEHVRIAVNVSSIQFQRPGLSHVVLQALQNSGLKPERLEIEITESIFLERSDSTLQLLHTLRGLGVRIALDDFGTGYSSLSYLQSFPFDKIKIDRSFVMALQSRPGAAAIVKAIIDLADALGMETTAEGVEEASQLNILRRQGATSIQGFLFSKAVPFDDATRLLKTKLKLCAA